MGCIAICSSNNDSIKTTSDSNENLQMTPTRIPEESLHQVYNSNREDYNYPKVRAKSPMHFTPESPKARNCLAAKRDPGVMMWRPSISSNSADSRSRQISASFQASSHSRDLECLARSYEDKLFGLSLDSGTRYLCDEPREKKAWRRAQYARSFTKTSRSTTICHLFE